MLFRMQLQLLAVILVNGHGWCQEVGEVPSYQNERVPCAGCPYDLNLNAEGLNELVDGALQHIESERPQKYAIINILKAQAQVVSGMLYTLTIEVAPTVCSKEVNHPCPINNSENEKLTCIIKFWEQPWLGKRDITQNTCTISQQFTPKSMKHTTQVPKTTRSIDDVLLELDSQIIQTTPIAETNERDDSSVSMTGNKPPPKIYSMYAPSYPYYVPPRFMYAWENLLNENQAYQNIENYPYQEDMLAQINDPVYRIRRSFNKNDVSDETKEKNSSADNLSDNLPTRNIDKQNVSDGDSKDSDNENINGSNSSQSDSDSDNDLSNSSSNIKSDSHDNNIEMYRKEMKISHHHDSSDSSDSNTSSDSDSSYENSKSSKISDSSDSSDSDSQNHSDSDTNNDSSHKHHIKYTYRHQHQKSKETNCEDCESNKKSINAIDESSSVKRVSKADPHVTFILNIGLQQLDDSSNYPNRYKVKEILDVDKKTMPGDLWSVKAIIVLSDCKKTDQVNISKCGELDCGDECPAPKICDFRTSEREFDNRTDVDVSCPNYKAKNVKAKRDLSESYADRYQFVQDELEEESRYAEERELFNYFKHKYGRLYTDDLENERRLKIFSDNLRTIRLLNKFDQGTAIYGLTPFADLTRGEFSKRHGLRNDLRSENELPFADAPIPDIELPTEFDWRTKNVVTKVKNQGSCGSCWAFSTTGNVEGQYAIKYGKLVEFSEQELVDCDKVDEGCNGGLMDNAYRAIEKLGGLETEQDYPYEGEDEKCAFIKSKTRVQLKGAVNISHDETDMAKWLVANGPISIAINANAMQFYMGGVSHPWKFLCNPGSLDHGVLIVGYGVHKYPKFNKTMPYWIVKNSWGPSWGEQGYYRVFRGDGTCGVNQTPSSAIVA